MQQRHPDEALRGLRVLPFSPDQIDLASDYLANNLSCLLQQQDQEELVIRDLDLDLIDEVRKQWAFYRDRRPDAYDELVAP